MRNKKVLERINQDLEQLASGVTVKVDGQDRIIKGALLAFIGDTLAAHEFCGFKTGVGF